MVSIKRPETTVDLWEDADLHAEWQAASETLTRLRREHEADRRETGDAPAVQEAATRVVDLEKRALNGLLSFRLRALPRVRFAELQEEHPPREGDKNDEFTGVNLSTFIDAVMVEPGTVAGVTRKATGEAVDFDGTKDWMALADEMSDGQWQAFVQPLLTVNRGQVAPGFNRAAWAKIPS